VANSYQFASPVRWIETQEVLFGQENIDRMIEIGPNNTLAAMAKKTLASQYSVTESIRPRKREILCHATDAAQIFEETAVAEVVIPEKNDTAQKSVAPPPPTPPKAEAAPVVAAPPPQQAAAMREIADVPISAGDLVTAIVSSKLKKASDEINGTQSIKTLTGGKLPPQCHSPTISNIRNVPY
jgi:fatty acid synthase subunit alpha